MENKSLTAQYDELPLILRVIVQLFAGVVAGGVYRIARYFETKNAITLIAGLLITFTGVGNVISWLLDLICLAVNGKYTILVD